MAPAPRKISEQLLSSRYWRLAESRGIAATILSGSTAQTRRDTAALLKLLHSEDPEVRVRAADVARRITEKNRTLLAGSSEILIGLITQIPETEDRTLWHLELVAARTAHTAVQRQRCASVLLSMLNHPGNLVRSSALEGLGELALQESRLQGQGEPSLQRQAIEILSEALKTGTPAMKTRARHALAKLEGPSSRDRHR